MIVLVMGVTGAGKSLIGQQLADALGLWFIDADGYHAPESVAKMAAGIPLTDDDRAPWLAQLNLLLHEAADTGAVLACSALKDEYRERLFQGIEEPWVVYLRVSPLLAAARLAHRKEHFMPPSLIASQFEVLEEPEGERVITVPADAEPETILRAVINGMGAG